MFYKQILEVEANKASFYDTAAKLGLPDSSARKLFYKQDVAFDSEFFMTIEVRGNDSEEEPSLWTHGRLYRREATGQFTEIGRTNMQDFFLGEYQVEHYGDKYVVEVVAENHTKVVYVNAWQYDGGSGFDWYLSREQADKAFEAECHACDVYRNGGWSAYRFDIKVLQGQSCDSITADISASLDHYCATAKQKKENRLPSYGKTLSELAKAAETKQSKIAITLDDGRTWLPCPDGVRVNIENMPIDGKDSCGDLTFNFTEEGVITDVWLSLAETTKDENAGTESEMYSETISRLVQENQ